MTVANITGGFTSILLKQLEKSGLSILLLTIGLFYFGFRENNNSSRVIKENEDLKKEVRELRLNGQNEVLTLQRENNQMLKEILWQIKNNDYEKRP